MHMMRNKFKEDVSTWKKLWIEQISSNKSTKYYKTIDNQDAIAEVMFDAYTRGAQDHPKIKSIIAEYTTNNVGYYPLQIEVDADGKECLYDFQFGGYMWRTSQGTDVRPFDYSRASNLTNEEIDEYPSDTKVIRNKSGNIYYSACTHTMWKQCKSRLERFGFISMNLDSKLPEPSGIKSSRASDQLTPLSKVFTCRHNRSKQELQSDSFLKNIGEVTYSDYHKRSGKVIRPLVLVDENRGVRTTELIDFNTGELMNKKSFNLNDLVLVLDIDNGKQINHIKDSLIDLPYTPQYIIEEKGIGKTKKGNSTALVFFDNPMTKEQRTLLLKAYRYVLCCKYDVYAIDCHCTGIGYGKNPLKTHLSSLQRNFNVLIDNKEYRNNISLIEALSWAQQTVNTYESYIDVNDDKFISSCEELKNSNLKFCEILRKLAETKQEFQTQSGAIFMNHVFCGCRNDHFTKIEGPIYALQYYLLNGIDSINDENTPVNLLLDIYEDITERYENTDYQITKDWILKRLEWIIQEDRKVLNNPSTRRAFIESLYYQRNICIHNKSCRLMQLRGYNDFNQSRFKIHTEFEELGLTHRYSATQQRHGADTQSIKSMLYAAAKIGNDIVPLLNAVRSIYKNLNDISRFQNEILRMLPPTDIDKKRRKIIANLLISKVTAETTLENYEKFNGYGFETEPCKKYKRNNNISFWDFSLKHNKKFIDIEAKNRAELVYHIALYVNEFCNQILQFGIDNSMCRFNDIKPKDVRKLCKSLYSRFNINISVVHHIAISIKDNPKSPKDIYFELCTMNTREVANKVVSLCSKALGVSTQDAELYFKHRYRPSESLTSSLKCDIHSMLQDITHNIKNNECVKRWISKDLLGHIRTMIKPIEIEDKNLFKHLYKTVRMLINTFIAEILELSYDVSEIITCKQQGLFISKVELELGRDGLNTWDNESISYYDKIKHLQVVSCVG